MTLPKVNVIGSKIYSVNVGAVLGQISTGGASQLEEQMSAIKSPSMRSQTFVNIERILGGVSLVKISCKIL